MCLFNPVNPQLWAKETVFILGGGNSVTGEDLLILSRQKNVIGVNDSALRAKTGSLFSLDRTWINARKDDIRHKFSGRKFFALKQNDPIDRSQYPNTIWLEKVNDTTWPHPHQIFGYNSGFGAVILAAHGGASQIVLVGFDMGVIGNKEHWHRGYYWAHGQPNTRYKRWAEQFENNLHYFTEKNINIINASVNSNIDCFPKAPLAEVILSDAG